MPPRSVLITGCSRGIGFGLVKQFCESRHSLPETVIATCRDPDGASDLLQLRSEFPDKIVVLKVDVTNLDGFERFAREVEAVVGEKGLNMIVHNAGSLSQSRGLQSITAEDMREGGNRPEAFEVHCVGPLFLTRCLLPLLRIGAKTFSPSNQVSANRASVIFMSSSTASIEENLSGGRTGTYASRSSKTSQNQMMKTMAVDFPPEKEGILIMAISPGWVQTDMGGSNAPVSVEVCCSTMIATFEGLSEEDHGCFKRYNNTHIPW